MASTVNMHSIAKIAHASYKPPPSKEDLVLRRVRENNEKERALEESNHLAMEALRSAGGDKLKASQILDLKLQATNEMIADLTRNSKKLSDEEFYERLTALKAEHRQTLDMCERLYHSRNAGPEEALQTKSLSDYKARMAETLGEGFAGDQSSDFDFMIRGAGGPRTAHSVDFQSRPMTAWEEAEPCARKPPAGAPRRPRSAAKRGEVKWHDTKASRLRRRSHSLDNLVAELQREEARGELEVRPEVTAAARARVQELWDEVEAEEDEDEYDVPSSGPLRRVRSLDRSLADFNRRRAHLRQRDRAEMQRSTDDCAARWRHRITIPEPFNFSIRDEQLPKGRSRSMEQFEADRSKREQEELEECQKQFKANPVPANVFLPMYETMMERQESRRRFVKEYRREILQSIQQPFNFDRREQEKRRQNQMEAQQALPSGKPAKALPRSTAGDRAQAVVKAKPVPRHLFEDRSERLREDQLLRQIKNRMRAEAMLKKSKTPGSMEERQRKKEEQAAARSSGNKTVTKPKVRRVPDFEKLHQKMVRETATHQRNANYTKTRPFNFRTDERSASETRRSKSAVQENESNDIRRRNYEDWNQSILQSMELPQAQTTHSARLRDGRTKDRLLAERCIEQEREDAERRRQKRKSEMAATLRQSLSLLDPHQEVLDTTTRKTLELRNDERQRMKEYQEELRAIEERMKQRELLVDRQAQLAAKTRAERKFANILKGAGVDANFVADRGGRYQPDAEAPDTYTDEFSDKDSRSSYKGRVEESASLSLEQDFRPAGGAFHTEYSALAMADRPEATLEVEEEIEEFGDGDLEAEEL